MTQQIIGVGAAPNDNTGDPIRTGGTKINANFTELYLGTTPVGGIIPFAGVAAPTGWLFCRGQLVNQVTYGALFTVIGLVYGSGVGTFGIPDLQGRSVFGVDPAQATGRLTVAVAGVNSGTLGAAGGDQRMQLHNHGVSDPTHAHASSSGGFIESDGSANVVDPGGTTTQFNNTLLAPTTAAAGTGISVQNAGAGGSQNLPPAMMLNYIIFAAA